MSKHHLWLQSYIVTYMHDHVVSNIFLYLVGEGAIPVSYSTYFSNVLHHWRKATDALKP